MPAEDLQRAGVDIEDELSRPSSAVGADRVSHGAKTVETKVEIPIALKWRTHGSCRRRRTLDPCSAHDRKLAAAFPLRNATERCLLAVASR